MKRDERWNPIKAILFDLDDTLLFFEDYWVDSKKEAFRTYSLTRDIPLEVLFPVFLEKDEKYHVEWLEGRMDGSEFREVRFIETLAALGIAADAEEAHAFERWFWMVRESYVPRDEGVIEVLRRFRSRYPIGVVTNGSTEDQLRKLDLMGVRDLFGDDRIFVSDAIGAAKPQREAYELPAKRMGFRCDQILFVGDSWANDVQGPMAAGMTAVWVNAKELPVPQSPEPAAVVKGLEELAELLLT